MPPVNSNTGSKTEPPSIPGRVGAVPPPHTLQNSSGPPPPPPLPTYAGTSAPPSRVTPESIKDRQALLADIRCENPLARLKKLSPPEDIKVPLTKSKTTSAEPHAGEPIYMETLRIALHQRYTVLNNKVYAKENGEDRCKSNSPSLSDDD